LKPLAGAKATTRHPVPAAEVTIECSIIRDLWCLAARGDQYGRIPRLELV
jgi:hypothetical protein